MPDVGGLICFQYRHVRASFVDGDVAGNLLQNVGVDFSPELINE